MLFLEHFVEFLAGTHLGLHLIHLSESRVETYIIEIVAKQKGAETVDRCYLSIMNKRRLALQMTILRIALKSLFYSRRNLLSHLRSSSLCKSHYKKTIHIKGFIPISDHLYYPFDEDGRLTAARRRRNQYVPVSQVDYLLLTVSKSHSAHISLSSHLLFCCPVSSDQDRRHSCKGNTCTRHHFRP